MEIGAYSGALSQAAWPTAVAASPVTAASTADASGNTPALPAVSSFGPQSERLAQEKAQAKIMNDQFAKDCQTCKNRKYQDGSNDPGVSFKSPQHIDPGSSAAVVMGHEQEHVAHEQARAKQEGGRVVSQSVRLHGAICPECGRYYVAGGVTETTIAYGGEKKENDQPKSEAKPLDIKA